MSKFSEYFTYIKAKYIKIGAVQINEISTDGTLGGNSDLCVPTEKAVKTYVDNNAGSIDAMLYKGVLACNTNPNYPAANAGDFYIVSVAGKVGGSSGTVVEVGDAILCNTDATASGNEATVGTKWAKLQTNIADPSSFMLLDGDAVVDTIAVFDAAGQVVDSSVTLAELVSTVDGATDDNFAVFASGQIADSGYAASDFAEASHSHDLTYLAIAATAADSDLLGGASAAEFASSGHTHADDYIAISVGAATGDILYYDGADWVALTAGASGDVLTMSAEGIPEWAST